MDVERSLITLIAQSGAIEEAVARGIEAEHFFDDGCKRVYAFCVEHVRRYAKAPSFAVVRESQAAESFLFEPTTDSLAYLVDTFTGLIKRREVIKGIETIATYLDTEGAELGRLDEMLMEVALEVARVVPGSRNGSFAEMGLRIADYRVRRAKEGWVGIQMGIPTFDTLTQGVQPHEFVSVAGWQGTGKSTLLTYVSWHAYLQGKTPLIFSLEMDEAAVMRKFDLLALNWEQDRAAMIDSLSLKGCELTPDQELRWEMLADRVQNAPNTIRVIDDVGSPTLERLHAEIARHQPDMVGVDYVSLMQPPGRATDSIWQDLTRLTRGLKLMARTLKVPIWALAQTNLQGSSEGAKLENVAYSRSLGQDSDIVLGLKQDDEMHQNHQMTVRMLKNRDGPKGETNLLWEPSRARFGPWEDRHIFERNEVAA